MESFKVGHYSDIKGGTGCTVILCPSGTKASAYARGVSPGTREFALLSPFRKVEYINAVFLSGGSAFGLDATAGVMRYLAELDIGYPTTLRPIPIVPSAVIYDLPMIDATAFPRPEDAYKACMNAVILSPQGGNVGAGTGATVGKWAGIEYMMKGGVGYAKLDFDEISVTSLAVVNSVGDIINSNGKIISGAQDGKRFLARNKSHFYQHPLKVGLGENTVLIAIMLNVNVSKLELYYLAERAHNGIVKSVNPAHTTYDGDIIFTLTNGNLKADIDLLTEMAIETTRKSILNSVQEAEELGGVPAIKNLKF